MSARKGRSRRAFTGDGDLGIPQALSREAAFRGLRSGTGLGTGSGSFPQPGGPVSPQLRGGLQAALPCRWDSVAGYVFCFLGSGIALFSAVCFQRLLFFNLRSSHLLTAVDSSLRQLQLL